MKRIMISLAWAIFMVSAVQAGDVEFVEDFALAKDRAASLRQLIPGTEDYYYYHCLHYLNTEQFEKAEELTKPWLQRLGQTPRLTEIQTRHALLTYSRNPERSLTYLRTHLNLHFDHQKERGNLPPNLPTALDPKLIARETLRAHSMAQWQNLDNFEDSALEWLAADNLGWERRRNLLQRLTLPDLPNLPKLIADDFQSPHPQEFGSFPIHRQLTLAQLEELIRLRPELLNHAVLVQTYISKLHPGADSDWRHDPAMTRDYLDRLQTFVNRLAPVHNSLKAHVLYNRLAFDRTQGTHNKDRFLAYLKLPRRQPYMAKVLLEREEALRYPADLNADFTGVTMLPAIRSDEELVRAYLKHFLLTADSPKEFEPFINDIYLRHLYAETKIENGLGDEEQWASMLPAELFRQLKERIDIDFAATNKTNFAADEAVQLDLFVKNVPNLLVKVFEVNTLNFYRTNQHEVDTDINLDGLVANAEDTHPYAEPPLRRMSRHFEFPQLKKPGVYVIDFIGSGKSSRALIRKGRLRPVVEVGTAGQAVTVFDDTNNPVKDATIWLGGAEYQPDKNGRIILPYSTSPGRQPIVLRRGDFACLDFVDHQVEDYQLKAGIYVDRESLLTQHLANLLVRPGLFLDGKPVSVKLLEEVKLRITATDHSGIATSTEVPDFKLFEDRESVHEFRVPTRLASLSVTLQAKVKSLSQNKTLDLSTSGSFALNEIERTDKTEDLHLSRIGDAYVVELLGRNGEPKADRAVQLALKHRDFRQPVQTVLKTDGRGWVRLGSLTNIILLTATGPEGTAHNWVLPSDRHSYRQTIHAKAGELIRLPYLGSANKPSRDELALFEVQADLIRADRFGALAIKDSMLELQGLTAGDYDLWLKRNAERIRIRIADGTVQGDHLLGKLRYLELPGLKPIQIASITSDDEQVSIRLLDVSPFTRVHIFATRYQPAFSAFDKLSHVRDAELTGIYPAHAESTYLAGRNIGDEYRYVLDRRGQKKYAGNMLDRPGLLLNPWAVRSTETGEQFAAPGMGFGAVGKPPASEPVPSPKASLEGALGGKGATPGGDFANLDFLADASAVVLNQVPDKEGTVRVPRKVLGPHTMIHVVAVDPLNTTYRSVSLPEQPVRLVDLRLKSGLDPKGHFTQQKQVSILLPGQKLVLEDLAGSRFETYDSLAKVYALYGTLFKDPKLTEFTFLLNWPKLKPEEKRALYSKYASHELHFFLAKKDPAFFQAVVLPYLANKKVKTFMDRWLLKEDLSEYLQPWSYGRLNTVERILLAQRLQGEPAKTARYVNDLVRLQPPNIERFLTLFDTAVRGRSLSAKDVMRAPLDNMEDVGKDRLMRPESAAGAAPALSKTPLGGMAGKAGLAAPREESKKSEKIPADRKAKSDAENADEDKAKEEKLKGANFTPFFRDDRDKAAVRQLYRRLEPTMEWAENNYYQLAIQQQLADLVPVSQFWLDYARHEGKGPFLSRNFADASRNFTEILLALAVLDLPFEAGKHDVKFEAGKMTFTPASPVIAFHEEVRKATGEAAQTPILISQNFYRLGDRYREENGEKVDKFVTGEFLVQTVYGCQVVVTNPTSARQRLSVLIQLPVGSIPVSNGQFTKSVMLDLEPYRTQAIDYFFYFPTPGKFVQFPVHVAKNEKFIVAAASAVFDVVEKPSKVDTSSWEFVSQNGTAEEVLALLSRENVIALNLEKIAFRMKDRAFFEAVLQLLRERHAYQATLWSYALFHNDAAAARQYLAHVDQMVNECGGPIRSPLLNVDPVARHQYEHLEYKPFVNARAHSLGHRRQIVNNRLHEQYHRFLKLLSYHAQLNDDDKVAVCYYLLLQDRIEEALATFAQVQPDRLATRLQYDYCAAYLDLFNDEHERARAIASRYLDYPVDRWRNVFTVLVNQLNEADGKGPKVLAAGDGVGDPSRGQRQGQLAATEPAFDFTVDSRQIHLTWQNLNEVRVNYYLMDVELLFSRNPFVQEVGGPFASIRPNATQMVKLPADKGANNVGRGSATSGELVASLEGGGAKPVATSATPTASVAAATFPIPLPKDLVSRNVLVEVTAAGKTRSHPYYANAMNLRLLENYGQLMTVDSSTGKGIPKVYVKVYARLADGTVKFHKDGYTDLRGRFDYASVSTSERQPISRFAILALSEERGALIQEAATPQQ